MNHVQSNGFAFGCQFKEIFQTIKFMVNIIFCIFGSRVIRVQVGMVHRGPEQDISRMRNKDFFKIDIRFRSTCSIKMATEVAFHNCSHFFASKWITGHILDLRALMYWITMFSLISFPSRLALIRCHSFSSLCKSYHACKFIAPKAKPMDIAIIRAIATNPKTNPRLNRTGVLNTKKCSNTLAPATVNPKSVPPATIAQTKQAQTIFQK
ncbi:hypothetical protein CJ20_257 [Escherichia phage CJ20]|nr:hypothetical protein CJ20_257 [Escherichia phage CJ20]